jgi:prepilin-type N-terminal cleavage/methylation domain-containing protein
MTTTPNSVRDAGFTLVEVLVAVSIMSIAFVTILEGVAVFTKTTHVHRTSATLDTAVRNYATQLEQTTYVDCTNGYSLGAPTGTSASVAIDYWRGDATPASFSNRSWCTSNGDRGAQRLRLTLTDTATGQVDSLTIVKRRP